MTGRIRVSHLYSGYHDLNGRGESLLAVVKAPPKFVIRSLAFGDVSQKGQSSRFVLPLNNSPIKFTPYYSSILTNDPERINGGNFITFYSSYMMINDHIKVIGMDKFCERFRC